MTRKWNIVNDNSNENHGVGNKINYNIEVLKSNLCDYNDEYILVRRDIIVTAAPVTKVFKNCALLTKCITTTDDAENLDLVMPLYNLIEYSSSFSAVALSLWFYSKDETTGFNADVANTDKFISFKYKAKLLLKMLLMEF